MTYISDILRKQVIERADNHCEYCLVHQITSIYKHEIDHIIPEKHRGKTDLGNLCLSCLECNRHKGSDFASFDPQDNKITLLFNPRTDKWQDHFRLEGAEIVPLNPVGRVTVFVLKLNEDFRLKDRAGLAELGRYP